MARSKAPLTASTTAKSENSTVAQTAARGSKKRIAAAKPPAKSNKMVQRFPKRSPKLVGRNVVPEGEVLATRKRLAEQVIEKLSLDYPEAECALEHETPEQLLVATILSAQCTDVMVNKVTRDLFAKYPGPETLAQAPLEEVEQIVKRTGFYKNKAKNIVACAQALVSKHGGKVPRTLEAVTALPGAGRKTANVVLGNAFGIPGMVVDTHVLRLSQLIGLVDSSTPEKVELELMAIVSKEHWVMFSHWLIHHGRAICIARRPKCEACVLNKMCAYGVKELAAVPEAKGATKGR